MKLAEDYTRYCSEVLNPTANAINEFLASILKGVPRVDRVSTRVKSTDRFLEKAKAEKNGLQKYSDPFFEIQDLIGSRVIVFYDSDVRSVTDILKRYLRPIETSAKEPEKSDQFGYFGWHAIYFIPTELVHAPEGHPDTKLFELQVKTLFQHAWSEAEHDLTYKQLSGEVSRSDERLIAFAAAQAWGADKAFEEVFARATNSKKPA